MLMRMVGKMLFKATVPLIAVAGVLTYGLYMRGGDPGALWKGVVGNTVAQASSVFSGIGDDASSAVGALAGSASRSGASADSGGLTTVYTWQDAQGVTHYSSVEPGNDNARTVTVDPDVNILAPVRSRPAPAAMAEHGAASDAPGLHSLEALPGSQQHRAGSGASGQTSQAGLQEVREQLGGSLPGVAGQVLSTSSGAAGGALDPSQLIRMLQQQ